MSEIPIVPPLFGPKGDLRADVFEPSALQLLEVTLRWLISTDRSMFLPIDLLTVLVQQREPTICRSVARLVRGNDDAEGLGEQLANLARRIDRRQSGTPTLHATYFSLGFSSILSDAWEWASETGRERIAYRDIVRVVRWRAEYQESASVRWALRQLVQPGGERIFDSGGTLLEPLFSSTVLLCLEDGVALSARAGLPFLGTPHLIAALCKDRRSLLWKAAEGAAIDPMRVRDELLRIVGQRHPEQPTFPLNRRTLTPRVVRMLVLAVEQAEAEGRVVDEADLLDVFLEDGGSSLELLRALGVEARLRERLAQRPIAIGQPAPRIPTDRSRVSQLTEPKSSAETLASIGRDLTEEAREGRLHPVLGRDDELQRVVNVLLRTEQRNPLLTGEPGVGKTAIASALAQAIVDKKVPRALHDMRVVELNGASLVGGTSFRGELEERIARILAEAEDNVILFMDEAHAVFAPTGAGGRPAEVPNHFKAALASGKIAVVAATTDAEYQRWFEQDPALKRRFERVHVAELPAVVTRRILLDLSTDWESRYEVMIPEDAVDAAVELSMRFLPELSQPDKAKKLLMDASIAVATARARAGVDDEGERPVLSRVDVATQLSTKTGIPLARILRGRSEWWRGLSDRLNARVPGRDAIVRHVTQQLLAGRIHSHRGEQATHSVVFSGAATGAKEALARALAEEMFGNSHAFLKLDMSDFQDAHSISRLLGSPPGYVGYQDEDALVTPLRRRPAQVVYLADFHLSHPQIRDRILRMLDDGEISDMRGMRADCRHAIFVLAVDTPEDRSPIGFSGQSHTAQASLERISTDFARAIEKRHLDVVVFTAPETLGVDDVSRTLLESAVDQVRQDMREAYGMIVEISDVAWQRLVVEAQSASDIDSIQRLVDTKIVRPAIAAMLEGKQVSDGIYVHPSEDRTGSYPRVTSPTAHKDVFETD